jgi:hypothetical protein
MATQILKDKRGVKIGEIQEQSGKLIIKDVHGITKGVFDPKTNITKNVSGITVGTGNLLVTLL